MIPFILILLGWLFAQAAVLYFQNRKFIVDKLEALTILNSEINFNHELKQSESSSGSYLTYSREAYNNLVHLLGFLDSELLDNIMTHYAIIDTYQQNHKLYIAALLEFKESPETRKKLEEDFTNTRISGEEDIKSIAETCIIKLDAVIDLILKKWYYFLNQNQKIKFGKSSQQKREQFMAENNLLPMDKIMLEGRIYPAIRSCVNNRYKIIVAIFAYYSFIFSSNTFCQITNQYHIRIGSTIFFLIIVLINSFNYWENAKEQVSVENEYKVEKKSLNFLKIMNIEIPFVAIVSFILIYAYFSLDPNCADESIGNIINLQNTQ